MKRAIPLLLASAVFHYLGPSFAVLLFSRVSVLGVAWLRIASAAAALIIMRPRFGAALEPRTLALGATIAAMNIMFYLAISLLPLSTVGAIEFLGTVTIAALGFRSKRNFVALALTTLGVGVISQIRFIVSPIGFVFAFGNAALFMLYITQGHRIAEQPDRLDRLAAAMVCAFVMATPLTMTEATPAFANPVLLIAGVGVGVCSSVIPYVLDQLAMARLSRGSFALMLAILPMLATLIGAVVLRQIPTGADCLGIALVACGVGLHQQESS